MNKIRTIKRIIKGKDGSDGAGVKLVRVFALDDVIDFDPFLMLDAFDSSNPNDYIKGFPWHPHRGIETITYLLEGIIEHGDSLKNKGQITSGDCQWMTAGSGIIHQEMPQSSPRLLGAQLWLNLPAASKMTAPKYNDIKQKDIPILIEDQTTIRVIGGQYKNTIGALADDYVKIIYLDVEIKANQKWEIKTNLNDTVFVYLIDGSACFDLSNEEYVPEKHAVLFTAGENLIIKAGDNGLRLLYLSGKPLKEPIAWGGPIVMNTEEELDQAWSDLDSGNFVKS